MTHSFPTRLSSDRHLTRGDMPPDGDGKQLERLTAAAFGQRRKMLRASLKAMPGALAALESCGIDSARRAETLSVAEFTSVARLLRSEEHTSELQSLMRISYAVFCLKKKTH